MSSVDDDYLPGTERLYATEEKLAGNGVEIIKDGDIVLVPQPSDSPNDPLTWSKSRKYWHMFLVCFVTALTAATSNDAGAAQDDENAELGISYNAMNTAAGVLFIGIGYWTFLISPAAFLYGRRITYLLCILIGLGGAIWFARIEKTTDSVFNQLFVGASEAVAEANVQLSLTDIFFQHQLGGALGLYVLATSIGTYLGPLIAGYIDEYQGFRWIGWWSVIISGATLLVLYFGLEETSFDRRAHTARLVSSADKSGFFPDRQPPEKLEEIQKRSSDVDVYVDAERDGGSALVERKKTYWERIALITPAHNLKGWGFKQYIQRLWLTCRVFCFPAVLYSGLQWGAQDAWLTFYLTTEDENWTDPPYNYGDAADAIMNVPTLIGAVIGCFYGGWLSDQFVLWMARRNGGIKEAEHRLYFMFLAAIISPVGMLLFGIGTAEYWGWVRPYIGLAFIGFGWGCAGDMSMSYLADAYPEMVLEGMVGVSVINNTIGCIFTFACQSWIDNLGTQNTYISVAVLDFAFIMTTAPMIIYGKRCRQYTRKYYERFLELRDS